MSFQAYIDNIKAKTGKTPDDFKILVISSLSKAGSRQHTAFDKLRLTAFCLIRCIN
jgi:hypothetical protein